MKLLPRLEERSDQAPDGFSFEPVRMGGWCGFSRPITGRSEEKTNVVPDYFLNSIEIVLKFLGARENVCDQIAILHLHWLRGWRLPEVFKDNNRVK